MPARSTKARVDANTNTTDEPGQHNDAPRHTRGTNINVSI
jgi:hypothetical protein